MAGPEEVPPPEGPGATPPPARQYEFSPEQDRLIADLGDKMVVVGYFALALAVLDVVAMFATFIRVGNVNLDISAILFFLIGLWTVRAGRSFRDVARTQGRDITHLLDALVDLRNVYALFYWLLVLSLVLFVVVVILVLLAYNKGLHFTVSGHPVF
jgi:hypothetical protein